MPSSLSHVTCIVAEGVCVIFRVEMVVVVESPVGVSRLPPGPFVPLSFASSGSLGGSPSCGQQVMSPRQKDVRYCDIAIYAIYAILG